MLDAQKTYKKYGNLEGWLSIVLNLFLFVIKFWAGIVSGSVAIIADAWHTLSDSFTSVIVLVGIKISSIPPDKEHPFGHGRAELIGSIIIGVLLGVVGFNFVLESIHKLSDHTEAVFGKLAIIVTAVSVVLKEGMAQFAVWAGKKVKSQSMIADGWHHRSDAASSLVILIGIFLNDYYWWIDGVMGILVAIFIFYTTYVILKDAVNTMLGETPDEGLIKELKVLSKQIYPSDLLIHKIQVHKYGNHTEFTFHIKLPHDYSLSDAHQISFDFETLIKNELDICATIHMEPAKI